MGGTDKGSAALLSLELSQLKYVFFGTGDGHLVRADYEKAVATGGAMLSGLQQGYADAISSSSGAVYFQDSMGFMYDWGKNVRSSEPMDWDRMRSEMMAALAAGDVSKLIPSYPYDRFLKEDGSLGIACYPLQHGSLELDGLTRNYYYYVPSSYDGKTPVPLVLSFHGMHSSGMGQQSLTKMDILAEKEGFIIVYPDGQPIPEGLGILQDSSMIVGYQGLWNFTDQGISDLKFVSILIDKLGGTDTAEGEFNIDRTRVYAVGMSNGGIFSHKLAIELSHKIAAVASVTGPLAGIMTDKVPARPITVIQASGDADPVLAWNGNDALGTLSVDDTVAWWTKHNRTSATPVIEEYPPAVPEDPTRVTKYTYAGGINDTKVILYKIKQMGHTWPMGPQYLPIPLIGNVSYQIDLNRAIWDDIKDVRHPK